MAFLCAVLFPRNAGSWERPPGFTWGPPGHHLSQAWSLSVWRWFVGLVHTQFPQNRGLNPIRLTQAGVDAQWKHCLGPLSYHLWWFFVSVSFTGTFTGNNGSTCHKMFSVFPFVTMAVTKRVPNEKAEPLWQSTAGQRGNVSWPGKLGNHS